MWRTKNIYPLVNNIVMSSYYTLVPAHLVAQQGGVPGDVGPDGQHTVRAETGEPRARAVKLGHGHLADWPGGFLLCNICIKVKVEYNLF